MDHEMKDIKLQENNSISIGVLPGHFATSHSHINYYIDMTKVKHNHIMARNAARIMAAQYANTTSIDTVVCMDGAEVIGSFLARSLSKEDFLSINQGSPISVITPEYNSGGQMIFRDNLQSMVRNRRILLLIASVTTGKTIRRALECISYYGGALAGISAVFSAIPDVSGEKINYLFSPADLPDYHTYAFDCCPECAQGTKIDAIVNSYGYSEL